MKKIFTLILALLMILPVVTACGSGDTETDNPAVDEAEKDKEVQQQTEEVSEAKLEPDLPAADFGGQNINFLVKGEEHHWYWCSKEIFAAEENGERLNDAVYKRNRYLEDKYNFNITEARVADPRASAAKSIKADDKAYDVVMTGLIDGGYFAQSGMLTDLFKMPNIDLSQPWWDQRGVNELSIGKKLFFALGDINVMDNDATQAVIVNKKLLLDYELENPYELVLSGKWTIDKYYDMIRTVSRDVNLDGKMAGEDILGHLTDAGKANAIYIGGGGRITTKDADDYPVFCMNNEKAIEVFNKTLEIMIDENNTLLANDYSSQYANPWDEFTRPMFINNQGLFYLVGMGTVQLLRNMESDFGLLPLPKFDELQSEYYNAIEAGSTTSMMIPSTNDRLEFTGHVLEAIAAESKYTLTEAYYDINFVKKAIRDEESVEMLEIILKTRAYDLGNVYDWGATSSILYDMIMGRRSDFVSEYEKRENRAQSALDKTITEYKELG